MAREAEMHADQLKALMTNLTQVVHEQAGKAANDYFIIGAQTAVKIFSEKFDPVVEKTKGVLDEASQLGPAVQTAVVVLKRGLARWLVEIGMAFTGLLVIGTWTATAWSRHEVAQLLEESASLIKERTQLTKDLESKKQEAADWVAKAGRAPVTTCGRPARRCVQVVKSAGGFGPNGEYMVLKGY